MMCLASCQVFGEILGKTIKETKHHQGRALHPILYAIRFLKTHSAVSPNPSPFGLLSSDAASILKSKIGIGD